MSRLSLYPRKILISVICTLGMYSASHAQVFECRDAQGKKIFANSCPAGSTKIKEISSPNSNPTATTTTNNTGTPAVSPTPNPTTRATKTPAEASREFAEWKRRQEEEEGLVRDQNRADSNKCYEDQKRLRELLNGQPLKTGVDANGDPIYMEDEKRLEEIKAITDRSKKCKLD
jgi:hypothetical protein